MLTREEAKEIFRAEYVRELEENYLPHAPNLNYWANSGMYGGAADIERRFKIGEEMIDKYFDWIESKPQDVIWITPDGTPAIELGFDVEFGGVPVRGFIDQVIVTEGDVLRVRDVKTGANPGTDFQLKSYAMALERAYGAHAPEGDFWMGKTGKPSPVRKPIDLTLTSEEEVIERFQAADDGITNERFEPKPSAENCRRCSVRFACEFAM